MVYAFLDFELDETAWELRRQGRPLPLQPKELELLCFLVKHRERVVSKEDLLAALWPDVAVTEHSLTRAVSRVRRVLGRRADVIRTHPRRGYRFCAGVDERPPAVDDSAGVLVEREVLIGREVEMERLRECWARASSGAGGAVLLAGELGVGKTRTAAELARVARTQGGWVLEGWCDRGSGSPPYWPWSQVVRSHLRHVRPEGLRARLGPAGAGLAALVPELGMGADPSARGTWTGIARGDFRVLDGLARWLSVVGGDRPALVILDDLHLADTASLRALAFVTRTLESSRTLLVATYREEEVIPGQPLLDAIAAVRAAPGSLDVRLLPLPREAAGRLVAELAGEPVDPELLDALYARTLGNPLFLKEIVRLWIDEGGLAARDTLAHGEAGGLPPVIRAAIGSRLARLSPGCRAVLTRAAVLGRDFEVRILYASEGEEPESVLAGLDEAEAAGILRRMAASPPRHGFSHPLVHEVVLGEMASAERARLHAWAARALEAHHAGNLDGVATELAEHHLAAARAGGDAGPALHWARRAGELAAGQGAHEVAAAAYERALEALELASRQGQGEHVELLLALALARGWSGDLEAALTAAEEAARLARRRGVPEDLARASVVLWMRGPQLGEPYERTVRLLEEAERVTRGREGGLRAAVLARLAHELLFRRDTLERRIALCAESELLLAKTEEPVPVSLLANLLFATWVRRPQGSRLAWTERMLALAEASEDPADLLWIASPIHVLCLLERGDVAQAWAEAEGLAQRIEVTAIASGLGGYTLRFRALRALFEGRFAEAERWIFEALELGRRARVLDPELTFALQIAMLRWEQGRVEELLEPMRAARARYPANTAWRGGLIHCLKEVGARDEAHRELVAWAGEGLPDPQDDHNAPVGLFWLASSCGALSVPDVARQVYERLAPFSGLLAVPLEPSVCYGSFDLALGQLALAMGRLDEAVRHLERAREAHERAGARPLLARTRSELARVHLARGGAGDAASARELLAACSATAEELGMARLAAEVREILPAASSVLPLRARRRPR